MCEVDHPDIEKLKKAIEVIQSKIETALPKPEPEPARMVKPPPPPPPPPPPTPFNVSESKTPKLRAKKSVGASKSLKLDYMDELKAKLAQRKTM